MKLLTKAHISQRRLIEILRVIKEMDKPVGARAISDLLSYRGYDLGERAVRYNLKILDELGFTEKITTDKTGNCYQFKAQSINPSKPLR